jgi:hypothetical protein
VTIFCTKGIRMRMNGTRHRPLLGRKAESGRSRDLIVHTISHCYLSLTQPEHLCCAHTTSHTPFISLDVSINSPHASPSAHDETLAFPIPNATTAAYLPATTTPEAYGIDCPHPLHSHHHHEPTEVIRPKAL